MRVRYRDVKLNDETLEIVVRANAFIAEYGGRPLSVRQVYYRFVAADAFPASWVDTSRGGTKNTERNYKALAKILVRARYAGLVDWDLVEDRGRAAMAPRDWPSPREAVEEVAATFRLDRWRDQPFYVELWCEKAALQGVLWRVASRWHLPLMVNRGYSSASAMRESAERIRRRCAGRQVRPVVLYLGDHDPSGKDMVGDVRRRLAEFGVPEWTDVREVALTREQVDRYELPPNPLKAKGGRLSDSRAKAYQAAHGSSSWEVDALPPDVLERTVVDVVRAYVDKGKMDAVVAEEELLKCRLRVVTERAFKRVET